MHEPGGVNWKRTGLVVGAVALLGVATGGIGTSLDWDAEQSEKMTVHEIEAVSNVVRVVAGEAAADELSADLHAEFGYKEDSEGAVTVSREGTLDEEARDLRAAA